MNLDRVTITGADDSVLPADLIPLTHRFPFVEWGILVSQQLIGTRRYPTTKWIERLVNIAEQDCPMQLSMHLCGRWVGEILRGSTPSIDVAGFQRIQLNFHAERHVCVPEAFAQALRCYVKCAPRPDRQVIFQVDGVWGNKHYDALLRIDRQSDIDAVPLFDTSGGAGVLPDGGWPKPMYRDASGAVLYHGYAGGLGPENLEEQIKAIAEAADDARIWIDMETRVRSEDNARLDLSKVERCLEIAARYMK
jgi:hypothetical protein